MKNKHLLYKFEKFCYPIDNAIQASYNLPPEMLLFPCFRNLAVNADSTSVTLDVTRAQGTHGSIAVSYITTILPERYTDNDFVVNRAIEGKDYTKTQGVLMFRQGQVQLV